MSGRRKEDVASFLPINPKRLKSTPLSFSSRMRRNVDEGRI